MATIIDTRDTISNRTGTNYGKKPVYLGLILGSPGFAVLRHAFWPKLPHDQRGNS